MDKGIIQWSGGDLQSGRATFTGPSIDKAKLDTFITALFAYTDFAYTRSSFVDETIVAAPTYPDPVLSTDLRNVVVCRDQFGSTHKYTLPRFTLANLERKDEKGWRIIAATLAAVCADISTLTGYTMTPVKGYTIEKQ